MKTWEYNISSYSLKDLGIAEEDLDFPTERVVACDTEGHCYFHDVMKQYLDTFKSTLNGMGSEGWELLQLEYHRGSLVCFWKREVAA